MSITEIEAAITGLPLEELDALSRWIEEHRERLWDQQIEGDLKGGKLDKILRQVDAEIESGLGTPL